MVKIVIIKIREVRLSFLCSFSVLFIHTARSAFLTGEGGVDNG